MQAAGNMDAYQRQFEKANADLQYVALKLEQEFEQVCTKEFSYKIENPMNLVKQLKRIKRDFPLLIEEFEKVTAQKQEAIDSFRATLLSNRLELQKMQQRLGMEVTPDEEDGAFIDWNEMCGVWAEQVIAQSDAL